MLNKLADLASLKNNIGSFTSLASLIDKLPGYFGLNERGESTPNSNALVQKLIEEATGGAISFADYLTYRYYGSENQIFFNEGNYAGFLLEVAPIVGVDDGLLKNLRFFFNDEMPPNCWLQFLMVASHDVEQILSVWEQARVNPHPILTKLTGKR